MENYGSFKNLAGDKKGMSAEEAYIMLKNLGLLGQEFVPGATSLRKLMEGDFKGAGSDLNEWIPGGKAVQNLVEGKDQDWEKNALDAIIFGKPLVKGVKKAASAIEKMPKGGKEGFLRLKKPVGQNTLDDVIEASNEAGQKITPEIESEIRNYVKAVENGQGSALLRLGTYDAMSPEAKQVVDGYMGQEMVTTSKPKDFDSWSAKKRKEYFENNFFIPEGKSPVLSEKMFRNAKDETYGLGHNDYGVIYPDKITTDDYIKAIDDREPELVAARKAEELKRAAQKEKNARKQAAKEAKWKAEREAAAKAAEEKRLAKEAKERRIAEEAEKQRLAEEAEAKRIADEEARKRAEEEEFERQFREEEGAERNRYADSLATVASREAVDNDINEWLYNKMLDEEQANPVTSMDQFTGESFGGAPTVSNPTAPATGKTRPSYDHSREFNGGTFQLLDPIDRGTLKGNGDLGERIFDAQSRFYTPYSEPGEYIRSMSNGRGFRELQNKTTARDPYNEAGVINDMNIKLNRLIDRERKLGFTDEEIYRKFKPEFDEYQGKIERYKTRLNSPQSMFDYDGAITTNIPASPSEEINVLRSIGLQNDVNPTMGKIMDKTRDHYQDLMKRIYQYESRFPQTPKLTNDQFKRLKDMGIRPEDIDMYLAEHPEFL